MKFSLALLAATASALELPSSFFTSNVSGSYDARNWAADTGSTMGLGYLTSKFNNRFRLGRPNQAGDTLTSNIYDKRGYSTADILATGEDPRDINSKFTESQSNWFGGCYFKPSR